MRPHRALYERLDQLRVELAASKSLSAAERERLETLLRDVRDHVEQVARSEPQASKDPQHEQHEAQSIADRLQDATAHFEETHPNLTLAIGAVADALSRLGI